MDEILKYLKSEPALIFYIATVVYFVMEGLKKAPLGEWRDLTIRASSCLLGGLLALPVLPHDPYLNSLIGLATGASATAIVFAGRRIFATKTGVDLDDPKDKGGAS